MILVGKAIALWLSIGTLYALAFELLVQKHYAHRGGRETFEREANGKVMPSQVRWLMHLMTIVTWPWWVAWWLGREIEWRLRR